MTGFSNFVNIVFCKCWFLRRNLESIFEDRFRTRFEVNVFLTLSVDICVNSFAMIPSESFTVKVLKVTTLNDAKFVFKFYFNLY